MPAPRGVDVGFFLQPRALRDRRRCRGAGARARQHDARRLAQHVAEAHAAARAPAVHRHYRGDDGHLADGPLTRARRGLGLPPRATYCLVPAGAPLGTARRYSSFLAAFFFGLCFLVCELDRSVAAPGCPVSCGPAACTGAAAGMSTTAANTMAIMKRT